MPARPGQEPCACSPPGPELQALCIRSQAPVLGRVEVVERTQAPKDWKAPSGWTEALCVPAQSLQRGTAPSCGVCWAAVRCVGECFAATYLASAL